MITMILSLAILGFIAWLIITYIPMPDIIKKVILVISAIFMILYVMRALGFTDLALPR